MCITLHIVKAEAICAGFEGKTAEEMGKYIADLCHNSPSHWSYIGSSKFSYIGVGVDYRAGTAYGWYGCVIRLIFVYVLHQMFQISFRHYHCCSIGEEERTEVYVMPISDFDKWLALETLYLAMTPNRGELYKCPAGARNARIQAEDDT